MAIDSDRDKGAAIEFGLRTPFWAEWLRPEIQLKATATLNQLAMVRSDSDDIKRGWIQALSWVLGLPDQVMADIRRAEEAQAALNQQDAREQFRAEMGYRTPFGMGPEETKAEDNPPQ